MIKEIMNLSYEVVKIYTDLERAVSGYKKEAGVDCLSGCGHCCNNPDVEASPGEFLPFALMLWESGGAMAVLSKINELPEHSVCVLYASQPGDPDIGGCSMYPYRGMICRLFGFTAASNKKGVSALITCRLIKNNYIHELTQAVQSGVVPPLMEEYTRTLEPLIAEYGTRRFPINQAIKIMVERIGFLISLHSSELGINDWAYLK
jgi:Fe-S-cluster containining protein